MDDIAVHLALVAGRHLVAVEFPHDGKAEVISVEFSVRDLGITTPFTVPVSLLPSALRFKVTVLVFPLGPCISAVHLPLTSAAHKLNAKPMAKAARTNFICCCCSR